MDASRAPSTARPGAVRPSSFPPGTRPSRTAFWAVFFGAWLAYAALMASLVVASGRPLGDVAARIAAHVVAHVLPALLLTRYRSSLLRPDRTMVATVALLVVAGVLYAGAASGLSFLFYGLDDPVSGAADMTLGQHVVSRFASAVILYMMLAAFLMWSESMVRVHESREAAAREAVLRARAESEALQARFNPHFVFNVLHSLILLLRADPDAAERAIEDVAELIRYASVLQREGVKVVGLEREVDIGRRYLALERLRLGGRLRVEWTIDDPVGDIRLPPFTLQTLLENAIKHGISPRPGGGRVDVSARRDGLHFHLTVADDGAGARAEEVRDAAGRGLDLVGQRLDLLFGEKAGLEWETAPGRGFRVTVRVPAGVSPTGPAEEVADG